MSSVPEEGRNNTIRHGFCNENFRPSCPSRPSRPSFRPGRFLREVMCLKRKKKGKSKVLSRGFCLLDSGAEE